MLAVNVTAIEGNDTFQQACLAVFQVAPSQNGCGLDNSHLGGTKHGSCKEKRTAWK